jgi:DNA-binding response OmpR family regulator
VGLVSADPSGFDALLTDVVMPRMPGTELAARVRSARPSLPILLLTGYSPSDLSARGLDASHGESLSKPFGADQLLAVVRHLCGDEARDACRSRSLTWRGHVYRFEYTKTSELKRDPQWAVSRRGEFIGMMGCSPEVTTKDFDLRGLR